MRLFSKSSFTAKRLTRAALIAALYVLLTFVFRPLSFGAIQLRIADALTLLPLCLVEAVPGLFVGCLLANLLGGAIWYDVVFGSLATLLAAVLTRMLKKQPLLAAGAPAVCNGLIVGCVIYFAYVNGTGISVLLVSMLTVTIGEAIVCYALALPFTRALQRSGMLHD